MLFTSLAFFVFLPLTLAVFAAIAPHRRWLVLLLASWLFYGAAKPANLLYLGGITLVVLGCTSLMARSQSDAGRRALLAIGLCLVLGSLVGFKFYDFAAGEIERWMNGGVTLPRLGITAPAGYSFYAFSAASVLIESCRGQGDNAPRAGALALYLAYFPKILAGPIERSTRFLPQLGAGLRANPEQVVLGLQLVLWGLVKKVVIADNLAPLVDKAFGIARFATPVELLASVYFFAFQIYCDFSGYTDIAIGVSLLFGLQLMENFRRPYLARSTAEFWARRWHISLGTWFRDYLYLPLGGSRAGRVRHYLNLMLVFLASGLWHAGLGYGVGWTFLVWGALNGAYQWAGVASGPGWRRLGERFPRVAGSTAWASLRVLLTFHLIAIAWVFFRAKSIDEATLILTKIGRSLGDLPSLLMHYPFSGDQMLGAALIALLIAIELVDERRSIFTRLAAAPAALRWGVCYLALAALLLLGRWQSREFIYMQF